jgi:hypothetical protein
MKGAIFQGACTKTTFQGAYLMATIARAADGETRITVFKIVHRTIDLTATLTAINKLVK